MHIEKSIIDIDIDYIKDLIAQNKTISPRKRENQRNRDIDGTKKG